MTKEIAIIGGGIAGYTVARGLESHGHSISFFVRGLNEEVGYRSVYTTFKGPTQKYESRFSPDTLHSVSKFHLVTHHKSIKMDGRGYFMVDYPLAIEDLRREIKKARLIDIPKDVSISLLDRSSNALLNIEDEQYEFDEIIDCTGKDAISSKENSLVEFVYGGVFRGKLPENEMLIAFVGEIGGTCWINPSVQEGYIDVVASAWGWRSDARRYRSEGPKRMKVLLKFLQDRSLVELTTNKPEKIFYGSIGSQVSAPAKEHHIYKAGDAGGMAVPKTGDGFRWAMLGAEVVADAIDQNISPRRTQKLFYKNRPLWKDRLLEGATLYRLAKQRLGILGTSVEPLEELLIQKPYLKNLAEQFFIEETLHPKLLFYILANPHFREIMAGSVIKALGVLRSGIDSYPKIYSLPEM